MQNAAAVVESASEDPSRLNHEIALNDIHNSLVRRGLDVWHRARAGRPFPQRADLTPRMLSDLLRNTVLVRVLAPGDEYELRIVGDAMVQAQGRSFQGMSMSEIDLIVPGHGSILRTIYNAVCDRHAPIAFRGWYTREADGRTLFQESVLLPLSNDGVAVDHLLVFGAFAFTADEKLR
jgi:hypothetical protein